MRKLVLPFLFSALLIGCHTQKATTSAVSDDNIVMKIIQINDVYEIEPINNGKNGGLARVAWVRDSVARENPNTWFFLAGDFLNPSLLGTISVDGEKLEGKQMVEVLNEAGLDLTTFGNHEFDIKEESLQKRMNESTFEWTSANVRQVVDQGVRPFYKETSKGKEPASDYVIYRAGNVQGDSLSFGVFGVTIPSNPKDFVHYGDIYEESVRAYEELAEETDFVLGLTHVSLEQDQEIAKRLPKVPLFMGGHEHYYMEVPVGKSMITKADANVVSLFIHTLEYSPKTGELDIDSEWLEVTDKIPSQPEVQAVVDKWTGLLEENLKTLIDNPSEVIYYAEEPLDGTDTASRSEQTNLGTIIGGAMSLAYDHKPDGAFSNGGGIRIDDRLQGEITSKDVFRVLPYGGKILVVEMTGKLLKETLDFGLEASGTGAYLQRFNIDQNKKGEWLIKQEVLDENKNYQIAMNDFMLLGLDVPFLTPENEGILNIHTPEDDELAGELRKSIIHYLKAQDQE